MIRLDQLEKPKTVYAEDTQLVTNYPTSQEHTMASFMKRKEQDEKHLFDAMPEIRAPKPGEMDAMNDEKNGTISEYHPSGPEKAGRVVKELSEAFSRGTIRALEGTGGGVAAMGKSVKALDTAGPGYGLIGMELPGPAGKFKKKILEGMGDAIIAVGTGVHDFFKDAYELPQPQSSFWKRVVLGATESLPMSIAAAGVSIATKNPVAGAAIFYPSIYGESFESGEAAGVSPQKNMAVSTINAAGQTAMESLPLMTWMKGGRTLLRSARTAIAEGMEEGLQQVWDRCTKAVGWEGSAGLMDRIKDGLAESMLAGALSGSVWGAATPASMEDYKHDLAVSIAKEGKAQGKSNDDVRAMIELSSRIVDASMDESGKAMQELEAYDKWLEERAPTMRENRAKYNAYLNPGDLVRTGEVVGEVLSVNGDKVTVKVGDQQVEVDSRPAQKVTVNSFPLKDKWGEEVTKWSYFPDSGMVFTSMKGQYHAQAIPKALEFDKAVRIIADPVNKVVATRFWGNEYMAGDADEMKALSYEMESKAAEAFLREHPDYKGWVPSISNADLDMTENLTEDTISRMVKTEDIITVDPVKAIKAAGKPKKKVGAPPVEKRIASLQKLAERGVMAKDWYGEAARAIVDAVGGEEQTLDKFLRAFAVVSTGASPDVNFGFVIKALYQDVLSHEIKAGRYPAQYSDVIERILAGEKFDLGDKKQAFYETLRYEAGKALGLDYAEPTMAVIDMWMARAFGYKADRASPTQYRYMDAKIKKLAGTMGLPFWQTQAAVWTGMQAKTERVSATVGEGIDRRQVGLYSEMITPADEHLSFADKVKLSEFMYNTGVVDKILGVVGTIGNKSYLEHGAWEGTLRPSVRSIIYGATVEMSGTAEREIVEQAAAALGYVLRQDAIAVSKAASSGHVASVIAIDRQMSIAERDWFAKELNQAGFKAFAPAKNGIKIIDFFDEYKLNPNKFYDILDSVASKYEAAFGPANIKNHEYRDAGTLIEKGEQDASYTSRFDKRPELREELDSLRADLDRQREEFYARAKLPEAGQAGQAPLQISEAEIAYASEEDAVQAIDEAIQKVQNVTSAKGKRVPSTGAIVKQLQAKGNVDFRGLKVSGPQDVAEIAAVYRNPRIEHFQILLIKDGKLLAHQVLTSGMPDAVLITTKLRMRMAALVKKFDCDVFVAHNHPSGNPEPSSADIHMTQAIARQLGDKFKGHIVTDGEKFSTIAGKGKWKFERFALKKEIYSRGEDIGYSPVAVAAHSSKFTREGRMTVLFFNAAGKLLSLENIGLMKNYKQRISDGMRQHDASSYIISFSEKIGSELFDVDWADMPYGLQDVIQLNDAGQFMQAHDLGIDTSDFMDQKIGLYRVREEGQEYQEPRVPEEETSAVNLNHLNIPDEDKVKIIEATETIKPELEAAKGDVLSHDEVLEAAKTSEVLQKGVTREQTLKLEAELARTRQHLAALAAKPELTKEFLDTLRTVSETGTHIARLLESHKIDAEPELYSDKIKIIKEILKTGAKVDDILQQSQGVNWDDADQVAKFYRKFIKPRVSEILDEYRYINLLSSPKTHIVNTFSNILQVAGLAPATKLMSGAVDIIATSMNGQERSHYISSVPAYYRGMFAATPNAIKTAWAVLSGKQTLMRPDVQRMPTGFKLLEPFKVIPRLLEASDVLFKGMAMGGEVEARLVGRQDADIEAVRKAAAEAASYSVFRAALDTENKTGQGAVLSTIDKMTSSIYNLRRVPGVKWFIPFVATPMNILKQGIEYSPLGLSTMVGAKDKTEQFAKSLIGSMVFMAAGLLALAGKATWAAPTGKKEKELFYSSGRKPFSLLIGGHWVSYSRIGVLAYPIAMAAAVKWYIDDNPESVTQSSLERATKALSGIAEFFANQSYMEGLGAFVDLAKGDPRALTEIATNMPQQLIPLSSLQRWVANFIDPVYRKADKEFSLESMKENIQKGIPGWSKSLEAYSDFSGGESKRQYPGFNMFSPIEVTPANAEGGQVYKDYMDIRKYAKEEDAKRLELRKQAIEINEQMKGMDSEEKFIIRKNLRKQNPELYEQVYDVYMDEKKGLTPSDKLIKSLGVSSGARAQYINTQIMRLEGDERRKFIVNLRRKGIITDEVAEQLGKLKRGIGIRLDSIKR